MQKKKPNKKVHSIRIYPKDRSLILKYHSSIQSWVDDDVAWLQKKEKALALRRAA